MHIHIMSIFAQVTFAFSIDKTAIKRRLKSVLAERELHNHRLAQQIGATDTSGVMMIHK